MAAATSNGAGTPSALGELSVKPPADIILPPKGGVRDRIHQTADFVYRRGDAIEDQMRQRQINDPKPVFSFILPEDPYHQYYRWYLQQLRDGKASTAAKKGVQAPRDDKPKGPPEPPPFRFSARMPNISAKDLEILKLTALYTARVGENWVKDLRHRESGNPQFDFLRANHSFFQYFRALVDQYKILLEEERTVEARIEELQRNIQNRFLVLDRAKQRAEYVKYVTVQREKEEKKAEDEKKEYASIDWHDFKLLCTVTFDEIDDASELPVPMSLNDIQSQSLEQKYAATVSISKRLEEAMPDEETYYNVSQQHPTMAPPVYPPMGAPIPPPVQPPYATAPAMDYRTPAQRAREEEEVRLAREQQAERDRAAQAQAAARGAPSTMRIRTDYVPRAAAKKANVTMVQCPNCKQHFPPNELDEHLRIELLDPRWKEQRDKTEARYATTMNTVDVASNLKRFASQRDDIYDGVTGLPISEEEQARRKKAATSYDGQPDPARDASRLQQMQTMNVQEQLRRIQERHGGGQ